MIIPKHSVSSHSFLCSPLLGEAGFPPVNMCVDCKLTCQLDARVFFVLVLTNILEDTTLFKDIHRFLKINFIYFYLMYMAALPTCMFLGLYVSSDILFDWFGLIFFVSFFGH